MKKVNPNHTTSLGDCTIIYPNLNDFEAGQEPAIIMKSYYDGVSVYQGKSELYLPNEVIDDFVKQLNTHKNLNHNK